MLPSVLPKLATDSVVRVFPGVWKLLSFLKRLPSRDGLQARILEWVTFPFSRKSSQPRDQIQFPCIAGRFFTS